MLAFLTVDLEVVVTRADPLASWSFLFFYWVLCLGSHTVLDGLLSLSSFQEQVFFFMGSLSALSWLPSCPKLLLNIRIPIKKALKVFCMFVSIFGPVTQRNCSSRWSFGPSFFSPVPALDSPIVFLFFLLIFSYFFVGPLITFPAVRRRFSESLLESLFSRSRCCSFLALLWLIPTSQSNFTLFYFISFFQRI